MLHLVSREPGSDKVDEIIPYGKDNKVITW